MEAVNHKTHVAGVVDFGLFAHTCKYFDPASIVNNGYGCNHPDQEETEEIEPGNELGKCYCRSCPIGCEAEPDDVDDENLNWGGMTPDPEWMGNEYLILHFGEEAAREAWINYQRYLHRYDRNWKPEDALRLMSQGEE